MAKVPRGWTTTALEVKEHLLFKTRGGEGFWLGVTAQIVEGGVKMWILTLGPVSELTEMWSSSILTAKTLEGVILPPSLLGGTAHVASDSQLGNFQEKELEAAVILA